MALDQPSVGGRLEAAKYILDLSYRLISHYDNKTNQLLVLVGFDFAVIGLGLTFLFSSASANSAFMETAIILGSSANFLMIGITLYRIKSALIPHVDHVGKVVKPKPGLVYFMDIKRYLGEEEYVKILLGVDGATDSKYYRRDDDSSFEKCLIEDCARDIFAHAEILELKTRYVRQAFNWAFGTTIVVFGSVLVFATLLSLGA